MLKHMQISKFQMVLPWAVFFSMVLFFIFGFAGFITILIPIIFGYREFSLSRHWHKDKLAAYKAGVSRKDLREDFNFFGRYMLYVYLPLMGYSLLVYILVQLSLLPENFWNSYFSFHDNFISLSQSIYPTIQTHYDAVVEINPLRAGMLAHLYAVIFNGIVLSILCFLPSLRAWILQAYYFEVKKYGKFFCAYCIFILLLVLPLLIFFIAFSLLNSETSLGTRRWGFNILENDKFFKNLYILVPAYFVMSVSIISIGIGYLIAFFQGKPKEINISGELK